jgi:hypothetical protein
MKLTKATKNFYRSMVFTTGITIAEWGSVSEGTDPVEACIAHP